jgi:hypothetical protein
MVTIFFLYSKNLLNELTEKATQKLLKFRN